MVQDDISGAFKFTGDEQEVAMRWLWSCLMDLSFRGKIETIIRIIIRKPPKWVGYQSPEYYIKKSFEELKKWRMDNRG